MQYKINTKAFHEAFKEPSTAFYKNWTCPIHGPRDICSHYTESFEKFKSEFMKKFIEPYTPQSLKPVGIHIAKKLVAPEGYEYGWKTYVNNSFKELEADDWFPVGYLSPHLNIPRDSSGLYIDGDAVLCMRIKNDAKPWNGISGTIAERAMKMEGGNAADIDDGIETLVDDTHYSMGNKHYKMPAEQNELGHTPEVMKAIVENAKKHIVPGWEDNEANRIARKAVEKMNRMELESVNALSKTLNRDRLNELGLSKQDETVDPREVLLRIFGEPKKVTVTEDGEALEINAFYPDGVVEDKIYETVTADPVPVAIATEFKGFDFEKINKDEDKKLNHLRYIAYLKSINSKQREGFSFDEAYDMAGKDYPEFHSEDPVPVEATTPEPKAYTYSGCDAEVWAPIMENMESNIAKANALEKVKESFPIDALTLIMGYHFGKNTADEMDDKRIDFVEKYRSLITDMGYSRF